MKKGKKRVKGNKLVAIKKGGKNTENKFEYDV